MQILWGNKIKKYKFLASRKSKFIVHKSFLLMKEQTDHESEIGNLGKGLVNDEFECHWGEEKSEWKLETILRPFGRHWKRGKGEACDEKLQGRKFTNLVPLKGSRKITKTCPLCNKHVVLLKDQKLTYFRPVWRAIV